ncbi:MAG: DNA cytosine methyltransferase [Acutalibacteraceae bacterium]
MVNTIDLFAGCGGLTEGFMQSGYYNTIACIEWDKAPCDTLRHNLKKKWKYSDADKRVIRFDIQRTEELFKGWNDPDYGTSEGLDSLVREYGGTVDLIIGGPPCQAYSVAGRIRDKDGMKNDYRNYLFENYITIVEHYRPKAFVFENVPGILSARPGDGKRLIIDIIRQKFSKAGYAILDDLSKAVIDFTEYGVPQKRSRVIVLALRKNCFKNSEQLLERFYNEILPSKKVKKPKTVRETISDLPALVPLDAPRKLGGKTYSHSFPDESFSIPNHIPRFSSKRDIGIFKLLTEDIEFGRMKYVSTDALKQLYTSVTGKVSNIHKYHVIRWDEPSNTIPAHLYKDGLRHIHPDSKQLRTITVREAARLQTFPDDYEFITGTALDYKMIGNAVPPLFAKLLADSIYDFIFCEEEEICHD